MGAGGAGTVPNSPFFAPSTPSHVVLVTQTTPGGTRRQLPQKQTLDKVVKEHKSGIVGCVANLMNAIVGSGIVGIPYAMKESGFCAGIILIVLCGILTQLSLQLLIETAKHVHVPSYETVAEAAFGTWGFKFIAINMFIMAYGAMLSYLMVVKDTWSSVLGIEPDDYPQKRAVLFAISFFIMVPLSSQRDMADLAATSRLSVAIDVVLVALVIYNAPITETWNANGGISHYLQEWVHLDTVFVGLGVLSFAYVCQHSAFIIAGSLHNPTVQRWSTVTKIALVLCAALEFTCGVSGYIGYGAATQGNILQNLNPDSPSANVARAMLGTTMLFVYPMESFVARHVCVVLLFTGRRAHEGEDHAILNRRDRRILLTVILYALAVLPAAFCEDMGVVLAITGAVGGSCLSYIGPGLIFVGIHGGRFLEVVEQCSLFSSLFPTQNANNSQTISSSKCNNHSNQKQQQRNNPQNQNILHSAVETTPLVNLDDDSNGITTTTITNETGNAAATSDDTAVSSSKNNNMLVYLFQWLLWNVLGMPLWCWVARRGRKGLTKHVEDMALKSPHPIRIGDVQYQRVPVNKAGHIVYNESKNDDDDPESNSKPRAAAAILKREGSLPLSVTLSPHSSGGAALVRLASLDDGAGATGTKLNVNQQIGQRLLEQQKQKTAAQQQAAQSEAVEADPQADPPTLRDFAIAIFLILFGLLAFTAGIVSIFMKG